MCVCVCVWQHKRNDSCVACDPESMEILSSCLRAYVYICACICVYVVVCAWPFYSTLNHTKAPRRNREDASFCACDCVTLLLRLCILYVFLVCVCECVSVLCVSIARLRLFSVNFILNINVEPTIRNSDSHAHFPMHIKCALCCVFKAATKKTHKPQKTSTPLSLSFSVFCVHLFLTLSQLKCSAWDLNNNI